MLAPLRRVRKYSTRTPLILLQLTIIFCKHIKTLALLFHVCSSARRLTEEQIVQHMLQTTPFIKALYKKLDVKSPLKQPSHYSILLYV
jgi:hypothetical protein